MINHVIMKKKRCLTYFKNFNYTFIFLIALGILISGCSTSKTTVLDTEVPPENTGNVKEMPPVVPDDDIEAPPEVPFDGIDSPPQTPSVDGNIGTPPTIPTI